MRRAVAIMLVVLLAGCGSGKTKVPDELAFDQAVAAYLERQNMDLKISSYRSFKMDADGRHADAEIAMGYAGGMIKATAPFVFHFEKTDQGWKVTGHEQKK